VVQEQGPDQDVPQKPVQHQEPSLGDLVRHGKGPVVEPGGPVQPGRSQGKGRRVPVPGRDEAVLHAQQGRDRPGDALLRDVSPAEADLLHGGEGRGDSAGLCKQGHQQPAVPPPAQEADHRLVREAGVLVPLVRKPLVQAVRGGGCVEGIRPSRFPGTEACPGGEAHASLPADQTGPRREHAHAGKEGLLPQAVAGQQELECGLIVRPGLGPEQDSEEGLVAGEEERPPAYGVAEGEQAHRVRRQGGVALRTGEEGAAEPVEGLGRPRLRAEKRPGERVQCGLCTIQGVPLDAGGRGVQGGGGEELGTLPEGVVPGLGQDPPGPRDRDR
jgi:hypothetical protein